MAGKGCKHNGAILRRCSFLSLLFFLFPPFPVLAGTPLTLYKYRQTDGAELVFYSPSLSQYIPHIMRQYERARIMHTELWRMDRPLQSPVMLLTDLQDDGNGGASPLPVNYIGIGMAPVNMSYYVAPTVERYAHLFKHEYTHTVMTDRPNSRDRRFRSLFGAKVVADNRFPASMLWSVLTTPRWYAPRWYHEGIACFMETWLSGGVGRALGGYDEMYFRSMVNEDAPLSTVVGLESEGSTKDFQLGANAYLYGVRFVNYLVMRRGLERVLAFYNRTDSSNTFFAAQFENVFRKSLREEWDEWRRYERQHQSSNIAALEQYPITDTEALTDKPYGSASPLVVDDSMMVAYAAVNHPGDFAHLERIDLVTGNRRKLGNIDGVMLYQVAYVALDKKRQRLFWTDRNGSWRGLRWKRVGERPVSDDVPTEGKLKYQRVSNIVYDNARDCLYGLLSHEGVTHLVRYDAAMRKRDVIYTFKFGVSVTDLDVSRDGSMLTMTVVGAKGENSIIMFNVDDLDNADYSYRTLLTLADSNLSQFRFSPDGTMLIGCSYYTGVSNVWAVGIDDGRMRLLSNTRTGLFAPYLMASDTVYAMQFSRDGLTPVRFPYKEITDCNSVDFLGQKAYEANPQTASFGTLGSGAKDAAFSDIYDSITLYRPMRETVFQGAYPDISGFTDLSAWNNVTPVLGYDFTFSDPLGLNTINLSAGVSPWSNNPWKNRFHFAAEWKYQAWRFTASWNKTDFYDLFGPTRTSRKGYEAGVEYKSEYTMQFPFKWYWKVAANTYGDMDALPMFQNVTVDDGISSFHTASFTVGASKTRTSLGGMMPEQGYECELNGYTYLADGKFFPSLVLSLDEGVLLPFMRNTSGWLRMAVGQNFGDRTSSFGNEYFGGFRNNYVDHGDICRFRNINAMPGTDIDGIAAQSFCKATGEINFQPIRFRNTGLPYLYPTYAQLSLFATDLFANPWGKGHFNNFVSIGGQMNVEIMLFNYMKTTWSFGYARCFSQKASGKPASSGEWLLTLKLL